MCGCSKTPLQIQKFFLVKSCRWEALVLDAAVFMINGFELRRLENEEPILVKKRKLYAQIWKLK